MINDTKKIDDLIKELKKDEDSEIKVLKKGNEIIEKVDKKIITEDGRQLLI